MVKLSIIIPAYNVVPWIEATLSSIVRSKGFDLAMVEIIVVDDGSTDDTAQVLEAFIKAHPGLPPIRGIRGGLNQGVSAARNRGLLEAQGEYVWFVDGDDMISPHALQHIFNIIEEHPGVDVIKTGAPVIFIDDEEPTIDQPNSRTTDQTTLCQAAELFNEPFNGYYICHIRHIWRRDLLIKNSLSYPFGITNNEDFCFTIQSILKADTAVDAPWLHAYLVRKHKGSATGVRKNPDRFIAHVVSAQEALRLILENIESEGRTLKTSKPQNLKTLQPQFRVLNLMIANNITHILDPLPLSFVRQMLRNLKEMGAYPFTPEPDHSRLLRFVMQHKWAIIAVSQLRRIMYLIKN